MKDAKNLNNFPYNFVKIKEQLESPDIQNQDISWLKHSYKNPDKFYRELFNYFSGKHKLKSLPFESYDVYYDIVIRNLNNKSTAFIWYDNQRGWHEISFEELHVEVAQLVEHWKTLGVESGQNICTVLPMGPKFLKTLLGALKLGLNFSCLPPAGDRFLSMRLGILEPDYIATDFIYVPLLTEFEELIIADNLEILELSEQNSYTYGCNETVATLFSSVSKNPEIPRPLGIKTLFLQCLRDGVLMFDLEPGDYFAAPDLHFLQYQPVLLLTSLLCGATYVHFTIEDIEANPKILDKYSFKSIGINFKLRDVLLQNSIEIKTDWKNYFKSFAESSNYLKWEKLKNMTGLKNSPCTNIFYQAACGGVLLFSGKHNAIGNLDVFPGPGIKWDLKDVNLSGQNSFNNFGFFSTADLEEDETPLGGIILSKHNNKWIYSGTMDPKRTGRTIPCEEIMKLLRELDFINQSVFFPIPTTGEFQGARFVLLVFVKRDYKNEIQTLDNNWKKDIKSAISSHLDHEFLPDKIEFYDLYPRQVEDSIDYEWCRDQYLNGGLYKKSMHPVYQLLNQLRDLTL